jgi:hypothetical protein
MKTKYYNNYKYKMHQVKLYVGIEKRERESVILLLLLLLLLNSSNF